MKKKLNSVINPRFWLYLLVFACVLVGGILILSEIHLIPVFLNVLGEKMNSRPDSSIATSDFISPDRRNGEGYLSFVPIVVSGDIIEAKNVIPSPPLDRKFHGIDFSDGASPVSLRIIPDDERRNGSQITEISFLPGDHCIFGEGLACTYAFSSAYGSKVIFLSVHSGLGGEADALRDLIEGTGINQGLYTVERVNQNIQALLDSDVVLLQEDVDLAGLELVSIIRIDPENLDEYMSLPVEQALGFAEEVSSHNPDVFNQDLILLETCGWRLPDDADVPGLENTSYSVYLILMGYTAN
jgi:hypothetical protein